VFPFRWSGFLRIYILVSILNRYFDKWRKQKKTVAENTYTTHMTTGFVLKSAYTLIFTLSRSISLCVSQDRDQRTGPVWRLAHLLWRRSVLAIILTVIPCRSCKAPYRQLWQGLLSCEPPSTSAAGMYSMWRFY
jgi:hypothetical protein